MPLLRGRLEFIGRYMPDFFSITGIADEVHELKGDTAQGNALGTMARSVARSAGLTGTLVGGYADDLFNVLYRLDPHKMVTEGYEWGESGVRNFAESYGVLGAEVTIIAPEENACSKAKVTKQVKRKPGASPLLFGKFHGTRRVFVSLEDISSELSQPIARKSSAWTWTNRSLKHMRIWKNRSKRHSKSIEETIP